MRNIIHGFVVRASVLAFCCLSFIAAGTSLAARANKVENWDNGSMNGWTNLVPYASTLSNPSTYLRMSFAMQSILMPVEDSIVGGVDASGGMFTGNYAALGVTNITFSLMTDGHLPAVIRFVLHSAVGKREWSYAGLSLTGEAGKWVVNNVPLDFNAGGWSLSESGASAEMFLADLQSVDRVGVRIQQSGTVAQYYCFDEFLLHGPVRTASIRGTVTYRGFQSGPVKIVTCVEATAWSGHNTAVLAKPGAFELTDVSTESNYWLKAFLDANTNGLADDYEPMGQYSAIPIRLTPSLDLTNVNIELMELTTADGLPRWWLAKYFGSGLGSGGALGLDMSANGDADGDGVSNIKEYLAGTDPLRADSVFKADVTSKPDGTGIVIKWKAAYPNQKFGIWRATSLISGFSLLQGGIEATPPDNSFEDTTATGEGPYFYKINVEN